MKVCPQVAFAVLALFGQSNSRAEDLFVTPNGESAVDIADVPLELAILRSAGLTLRDRLLEAQFKREIGALSTNLTRAIAGKRSGYLFKVVMYLDENDVPVIPEGQLLLPIGEGSEPIDALAEYLRTRSLTASTSDKLQNHTYYVWFKNKGQRVVGEILGPELRGSLEKSADEERRRRSELTIAFRTQPDGIKAIQRAAYWNDAAKNHSALLSTRERQERVSRLARQFEVAQTSFNAAYAVYQQVEKELARQQQLTEILGVITSATGILRSAIHIGALTTSDENQCRVSAAGAPDGDINARIELSRLRRNELTGEASSLKLRIDGQFKDIQTLSETLTDIFTNEKVPLPSIPSSEQLITVP